MQEENNKATCGKAVKAISCSDNPQKGAGLVGAWLLD